MAQTDFPFIRLHLKKINKDANPNFLEFKVKFF